MHQSDECPVHTHWYILKNKTKQILYFDVSLSSDFLFLFLPHFKCLTSTLTILRKLFFGHFAIMFRFEVELHGWGKLSSDKAIWPCNILPSVFDQCNNQT